LRKGIPTRKSLNVTVISVKTVEKHRASVMEKLGANDLPGLVRVAIKHNLIFLDD
jgi:FixJ family two-component response regulator